MNLGTWIPSSSEYRSDAGPPDGHGGSVYLEELGSWVINFRPLKIRVTHNYVGGLDMILRDKNGNVIAEDPSLNTGEAIDIDWDEYDIDNLLLDKFDQVYEVQNIEFFLGDC